MNARALSWSPAVNRWGDQTTTHLVLEDGKPACGAKVYALTGCFPRPEMCGSPVCRRCESIASKRASA